MERQQEGKEIRKQSNPISKNLLAWTQFSLNSPIVGLPLESLKGISLLIDFKLLSYILPTPKPDKHFLLFPSPLYISLSLSLFKFLTPLINLIVGCSHQILSIIHRKTLKKPFFFLVIMRLKNLRLKLKVRT